MNLYIVFVNQLIIELRTSGYVAQIGNFNVGCPAHADDLCILSLYKTGLNRLLDISLKYSLDWRYDFNCDKTIIMIWGVDREPNVDIVMNNEVLLPHTSCKHMGVTLCNNKQEKNTACEKRIGKARASLLAARGLGSYNVPVPPTVLSKIYWSVSIPKMVYGLDITDYGQSNIIQLDNAHRMNSKIVQGIPSNIATPAPLATLGWMSLTSYIDLIRIMFMIRTLCLPKENTYRTIMESRIFTISSETCTEKNKSPISIMYESAKKYGLDQSIIRNLKKIIQWKT